MDALAQGIYRGAVTRRKAADVTVVELQRIIEQWLDACCGWGRIDAVISPIVLRVTSTTAAEVHIYKLLFFVCRYVLRNINDYRWAS